MNEWQFSKPDFEFKGEVPDFTWSGHMFFVYDLVKNIRPKVIAELGTYKGTSALAFSQGIKEAGLDTELFCVDNWQGEEQTGFYKENVYEGFIRLTEKYFSTVKVKPLKMLFDDALDKFEDNSIDILHIDGLHTYEAVKHDYDTWKSKVKENGVILFHDIKVPNFGVKDVWKEVKEENKDAVFVEFEHNYGLGVVFKNKDLKGLFSEEFTQQLINYYFDLALEYRLRQRIIELEADKNELKKGSEKLDQMLRTVLAENTNLYKKLDEQSAKLNRKIVRYALKGAKLIGRGS